MILAYESVPGGAAGRRCGCRLAAAPALSPVSPADMRAWPPAPPPEPCTACACRLNDRIEECRAGLIQCPRRPGTMAGPVAFGPSWSATALRQYVCIQNHNAGLSNNDYDWQDVAAAVAHLAGNWSCARRAAAQTMAFSASWRWCSSATAASSLHPPLCVLV